MESKAKSQRKHAKRRALSRYGLALSRHHLDAIVLQIQSGKAKFVERQSNRVTLWEVSYEGHILPVVYDKIRKTCVTFLPTGG